MAFSTPRDKNNVPAVFGVSSVDLVTPTAIKVNPTTGGLLVDSTSLGSVGITPATFTIATVASGFKADYYCDGTDDNVQINAAITAISSLGGGLLLIKSGTYNLSSVLLIPSHIVIRGEGYMNTILKKTTGNPTSNLVWNSDQVGGNTNILIQDIGLDGNNGAGDSNISFYFLNVSNFVVERCRLIDGHEGFETNGCSDYRFINCIADGNYDWNFYNYNATRGKIIDCISLNAKHETFEGFGIAFYAGGSYSEIRGCYVYNSAHNGIQTNAGSASADVVGIIIRDNEVSNAGNRGIQVTNDNGSFNQRKISVINNRVIGSADKGIYIINTYDSYIGGNKSFNNTGDGIAYENSVNLSSFGNTSTVNNVGLRIVGDGSTTTSNSDWIYGNTTNFAASNATSGIIILGPGDISLDGQSNRIISSTREATTQTTGKNLTLQAGGATSGGTNLTGGTAAISGGISTGSGGSRVTINASPDGQTSGQTDHTPTSQVLAVVSAHINSNRTRLSLGTGSLASADGIEMSGNTAYQIAQIRHTTSNTAGNDLTFKSGGATIQATNKNAGDAIITSGISTGSGTGRTLIQVTPAYTGTLSVLSSITINNRGSGYVATDVLTISGGSGTGGTATVNTVAVSGQLATITVNAGGTSYTNGDVLTLAGGTGGTITINVVDSTGKILLATLTTGGSGYSGATGAAVTGGTGSGATFDTTIFSTGAILTLSLTTAGTGYALTTGAATTGGTGTSATLNIVPFSNADNTPTTAATFDGSQNMTLVGTLTSANVLLSPVTGRAIAQTAAASSVATSTVGATDASFIVSANALVTTATLHSFSVECAYTDEGNTARVLTFNFTLLAGTFQTLIANANGAVPYEGVPMHIRCKAATTITIRTQAAGTYTTVTYNIEGVIRQIA